MLSLLLHPGFTRVSQFSTHRYAEPVTLLVTALIAFTNMLIYSSTDYTPFEKELEKNVRNPVCNSLIRPRTISDLLSLPMTIIYSFILLIHRDLEIPTVKDEIHKSRSRYNTRVKNHHNPLVIQLLDTTDQIRRLKIKYPLD